KSGPVGSSGFKHGGWNIQGELDGIFHRAKGVVVLELPVKLDQFGCDVFRLRAQQLHLLESPCLKLRGDRLASVGLPLCARAKLRQSFTAEMEHLTSAFDVGEHFCL